MGSIDYHVRRSYSKPQIARKIHSWLDNPGGWWLGDKTHNIWRQRTHRYKVAWAIGFQINGYWGAVDAITHLNDDELFESLMNESGSIMKRELGLDKEEYHGLEAIEEEKEVEPEPELEDEEKDEEEEEELVEA